LIEIIVLIFLIIIIILGDSAGILDFDPHGGKIRKGKK